MEFVLAFMAGYLGFIFPLLLSVIFLLFRLSSRFGFSSITLKAPVVACVITGLYAAILCVISNIAVPDFVITIYYWMTATLLLAIMAYWFLDSRHLKKLVKKRITVVKNLNDNRQIINIASRIILFVIITPVLLITLLILWTIVTNPIFDKLERDKFIRLNKSTKIIFEELKNTSNGTDKWTYKIYCNAEYTGDWPTGSYFCSALISTKKRVISVKEFNDLHAKYYPMINNHSKLKSIDALDRQLPNDFGKKFVVSSAEQNFTEIDSSLSCNYLLKLDQIDPSSHDAYSYGSTIEDNEGFASIKFECMGETRKSWF